MHDISVVIPAYKASETIERAVLSVFGQKSIRAQVVVVIDGQCAATKAKLEAIADPRLCVLVNDVNAGAQVSRNRGLAASTSPLVMFLDADDYVTGDLLCALADSMMLNKADLGFGPWIWLDEEKNLIRRNVRRFGSSQEAFEQILLGGKFVHPSATLWSRDYVTAIGGWDEDLARFQDVEIALRGLLRNGRVCYSDKGAGVYVQHNSDHRITGKGKNAASLLLAAEKLLAIKSQVVDDISQRRAIAGFLHNIGSGLLRDDRAELGRDIVARARELGWGRTTSYLNSEARSLMLRQTFRHLKNRIGLS
ncbi:glycosyltransferase family 2 protein [Sphingobium limneticum]|uniref:glycosyltransferase family 2 protein n=1 Tax=Sphingobium limneticum TaxID=1007511 RepID=UPI00123D0356|nr:glycosyltransferase family 2 protein [Sphingobium limneticum]KAA9013041.1 glycosyltransferase family 2 protein [Sphingobium limneticum]